MEKQAGPLASALWQELVATATAEATVDDSRTGHALLEVLEELGLQRDAASDDAVYVRMPNGRGLLMLQSMNGRYVAYALTAPKKTFAEDSHNDQLASARTAASRLGPDDEGLRRAREAIDRISSITFKS